MCDCRYCKHQIRWGVVITFVRKETRQRLYFLLEEKIRNKRMDSHVRITVGQLMLRTYGPMERGRAMYPSIIQSIMNYAAPIWLNALEKQNHRQKILTIQRKGASIIVRAYRTASTKVILVLARIAPIDLVARSHTSILQRRRDRRRRLTSRSSKNSKKRKSRTEPLSGPR